VALAAVDDADGSFLPSLSDRVDGVPHAVGAREDAEVVEEGAGNVRGGKATAAAEEEEEEEEKAATGACATKIEFLWKSRRGQKVHEAEVCTAVLSAAAAHSPCAPAPRLFLCIVSGTKGSVNFSAVGWCQPVVLSGVELVNRLQFRAAPRNLWRHLAFLSSFRSEEGRLQNSPFWGEQSARF
jgi:hypothetical protein